ncbi:hypothetical protein DPEC_G00057880 [Dallia pectoralis]|uniref:Uncharacterized protein n=1 Tax=Dallia pectoralis TaxID=75939 RepID=A0ACC2H6A6_DALPE|nr:hypothetical protein DPEC_G00057880 [Dallia pectoralis]
MKVTCVSVLFSHLPHVFPQVVAQAVLFMCMNTAGIFISYLSDRAQRQAFLETRRCIEARLRLETENQRQVKWLRGGRTVCGESYLKNKATEGKTRPYLYMI